MIKDFVNLHMLIKKWIVIKKNFKIKKWIKNSTPRFIEKRNSTAQFLEVSLVANNKIL